MLTVSSLVAADHDAWIPLWRDYLRFYDSELPSEVTAISFSRLAERDGMYAAIARDDHDRAVGFVHWTTHSSTWNPAGYCYLEDLFVSPQARGGGIGRVLIRHVRDWADDAGCGKVYWLTQETNAVARAMYDLVARSSGFVHYEIPIRGA
jgi:GNAT superfamily N-acetyltransferase